MPFAGFEDWDDCIQTMTEEEGHDMESAENICGALQAEAKSEHGNVEELRTALERGAGLIADVGVDLVSGVDVPAIDSKWVAMKSEDSDHDYRVNTPLLKADDSEQRITYAAAMIPRELDKEGDVAPTPTVEKAAHGFLKGDGGIDTDHSLIDGEGDPVESWVLKEERTFDLPGGGSETYPEGTWMLGVEWGADAWDRIQAGELTGLSIYGMAEHVSLEKACGCTSKQPADDPCWDGYEMVGTKTDEFGNEVPNCVPVEEADAKREAVKQLDIPLANESVVHLVYESRTAAEKASAEIGLDGAVHEHEFDDMTVWMPGETHEAFVERYMELSEQADETAASVSGTKAETGDTHKGAATESSDMAPEQTGDGGSGADGGDDSTDGPTVGEIASSVSELTETVESIKDAVETEKQDTEDAAAMLAEEFDMDAGAIMDVLEASMGREPEMVLDAIESIDRAEDGDEMDDDEEEMADSVDKRAGEANLGKGSDGRQTAAKGIETDGEPAGDTSWAAAKEKYAGEN